MTSRTSLPSLLNSLKTNKKTRDDVFQMFKEICRILKSRDLHERNRAFKVLAACIKHQQDSIAGIRLEILEVLCKHPKDWGLKQEIVRTMLEYTRGDVDAKYIVGSEEFQYILKTWTVESEDFEHLSSIIIRAMKLGFDKIPKNYIIELITEKICKDADEAVTNKNIAVIKRCMHLADTVVRYGYVDAKCIDNFIKILCRTVNVRSAESWRIMQCLLRSERGLIFQYGLLKLLDNSDKVLPIALRPGILRGTVFFVGMSTWGSQKVMTLKSPFPAILPSFRNVLKCEDVTVISEVLLSFQRLIKKYGSTLRVEWDIIFDILKIVFTQFDNQNKHNKKKSKSSSQGITSEITSTTKISSSSMSKPDNYDNKNNTNSRNNNNEKKTISKVNKRNSPFPEIISSYFTAPTKDNTASSSNQKRKIELQTSSSSSAKRNGDSINSNDLRGSNNNNHKSSLKLPKQIHDEICKMINSIDRLIQTNSYFGSQANFYVIVELFQEILPLPILKRLLFHKLENAHPAKDGWIMHLKDLIQKFFYEQKRYVELRLEALSAIQEILVLSAHIGDDEITNEIILPYMNNIFNDKSAEVRKKGLHFLIETARQKYYKGFDTVLKILENCLLNSMYEDAQLMAINGLKSLLSSTLDHVPCERPMAILDLIYYFLDDSKNPKVRETCLECLLHLRGDDKNRCQWVDTRVRTSNFLLCSGAPPAGFIGVLPMSRYFDVLINRLTIEKDAYVLHLTMRVILTMIQNRFIIQSVPLGPLATKLCTLITSIFEGKIQLNAERLDGLFKNEPFHLVQRSLSRQQSSNGSMMEENEENFNAPSSVLYGKGSTFSSSSSRPNSRDSNNFSPFSSDGSVTSGSGENVQVPFQDTGISTLYRMLSTPLSSPITSPETTPMASPRKQQRRGNHNSIMVKTPDSDTASTESYYSDNIYIAADGKVINQQGPFSIAKIAERALNILCILAGCHGSLPFHVEDDIFRCFVGVLECFTLPRQSGSKDSEVYDMISNFTSIVLRGLSLHVVIAPTVAMNYLQDVINTLNHFVLSVNHSGNKKINFVSILNFCRTLLGSTNASVRNVIVEKYFLIVIDIVLAHLTYAIYRKSTIKQFNRRIYPGEENYLLALTYQTFAVCYTSCPQHLRSKYAPAIMKKLNLLRHHRKRKDAFDYDNENEVIINNATDTGNNVPLGLSEDKDDTFTLVDLLCDLVSRYTYMQINFLPLSSRRGGNNFMFPKHSTSEKTFICSSSLLTVRMGIRGMSEITVRGATGAKQWLIQSQQENMSASLHPLLRLMPATVVNSMLAFRNRAASLDSRRRSPYMSSPVTNSNSRKSSPKTLASPKTLMIGESNSDNINNSNTNSNNGGGGNADDRVEASSPKLVMLNSTSHVKISSPKARKKKSFENETSEGIIETGSPFSLSTSQDDGSFEPSLSAFSPIMKRPRSSTDTMLEIGVNKLSQTRQLLPSNILRLTPRKEEEDEEAEEGETEEENSRDKIVKDSECKTLLMQMAIGPPKSRLRNRARSEGQIVYAEVSNMAMNTKSILKQMENNLQQKQKEESTSISEKIMANNMEEETKLKSEEDNRLIMEESNLTEDNAKDDKNDGGMCKQATDPPRNNDKTVEAVVVADNENEHTIEYEQTINPPPNSPADRNSRNSNGSASIFDDLRASAPNVVDPFFLVSQLHIASNETLRLIPSESNTLRRALAVLDRTPCADTHKIGLIYVPPGAVDESDILSSSTASYGFLELMSRLGEYVKLEDCESQGVYNGGLDCSRGGSDGEYSLAWRNECCQIMFHCTLLMVNPADSNDEMKKRSKSRTSPYLSTVNKKRHVGNDFVHIIYTDNPSVEEYPYDQETMPGQFNCVHIVIRPLDTGFFRVDVKAKPNVPRFGPLERGCHVLAKDSLANIVRETAVQADIACRFLTEMNGGTYISHTMERLKQIRRMEERL